jgi:hypothetical protein
MLALVGSICNWPKAEDIGSSWSLKSGKVRLQSIIVGILVPNDD